MIWISRSGKFACDNQAGDDEAGYELSFYHVGDLKPDVACSINSKLRSERRQRSMSCKKIKAEGNNKANANNPPDRLQSRRFCLGPELLLNEVVVVEVVRR